MLKKVCLLGLFSSASFLYSTTYTVSTNADSGAGSFREALTSVNTAGAGPHTISFNASLGTITLLSDLPAIINSTTITINGNNNTVSGGAGFAALIVGSGSGSVSGVTINQLTVSDAVARGGAGGDPTINVIQGGGPGGGGLGAGGGLFVNGSVTLANGTISNCSAIGGAGQAASTFISASGAVGGAGGGGASFTNVAANQKDGFSNVGGPGDGGGNNFGAGAVVSNNGSAASGLSGGGGGGNVGGIVKGSPVIGTGGGDGAYGGGGAGTGINARNTEKQNAGNGGFGGGGGGIGADTSGTNVSIAGTGGAYGGNAGSGNPPADTSGPSGGGGALGGACFVYDSSSLTLDGMTITGGTVTGGAAGTGTPAASAGTGFCTGIYLDQSATLTLKGIMSIGVPIDKYSLDATRADGGVIINSTNIGDIVTITSTNTYAGGTTFAGDAVGTLNINSDAALGASGTTISITGNTILQLGASIGAMARPVVISGAHAFAVDTNGFNLTHSGTISGAAGSLTKIGAGTLTLQGTNSYGSTNTISGGTININADGALGTSGVNLVSVADGTALQLAASIGTMARNMTISTGTFTIDTNGFNLTNSGIIASLGTLQKAGAGILTLTGISGSVNPSGTFAITTGTLALSGAGFLSSSATVANNSTFDISQVSASSTTIGPLSGSGTTSLGSKTLTVTSSAPSTFSGVIQDGGIGGGAGGALTKTGASTFTLSGINSYTGGTTIDVGTLAMSGAGSLFSTGTVANNTAFDISQVTASSTIGPLSGAGTTSLGSKTLTVTSSAPSTFSGVIQDGGIGGGTGGALIKAGASTLTLTGINSYTGNTTIATGTLALSGAGSLSSSTTVTNNSTFDISQVTASSTIGPLSGSGVTSLGSKTLTVTSSAPSTFSGSIQDGGIGGGAGGALTKTGASTLTLTGINSYTGNTTITTGTLALSGAGFLSFSSAVANNGTFDISQVTASSAIGPLSGAGTTSLGSKTLTVTSSAPSTFSGVIQDGGIGGGAGGALTKTGASTFTLSEINTYTGGTTIDVGTLALSNAGSLSSTGTVTNNTTFDISQVSASATIGPLSGAGTTSLGSKTLTVTSSAPSTFSGVIQDGGIGGGAGGALTKTGASTFTLSGTNTYTGGTTIDVGTLALSGAGSLFSTGTVANNAAFDISQVTTSSTIGPLSGVGTTSLGSKTLTVTSSAPSTFSGVIQDGGIGGGAGGALIKTGASTFTLSGTNTYSGGTTLSAGQITLSNNSGLGIGTLTMADTTILALSSGISASNSVSIANGGTGTVNVASETGTVSGGTANTTGILAKTGASTLVFSGTGQHSGGTTIDAGTLALSGTGILPAAGPVNVNSATSTFDISAIAPAVNTTIGDLSGVASSTVELGAKQLITGTAASSTFAGIINGTGGSLVKQGTGNLYLSGATFHNAGTEILGGTLSGTTNSLQGAIDNGSIMSFNQAFDGTFAGALTGAAGTLQNDGAGRVTLTTPITQATTIVNQGTFNVSSTLTSPTVTVASSGTLMGTGTIVGTVTINGTMAPGGSIGTTTILGPYTHTAGSILEIELSPTANDLLRVQDDLPLLGTVTIDSGALLRILLTVDVYPQNSLYTIVISDHPVSGTYDLIQIMPPLFNIIPTYNTPSGTIRLLVAVTPIGNVITAGNAGKVAQCFDFNVLPADNDFETVLAQLQFLPTLTDLADALDQMQPSALKALPLTQEDAASLIQRTIDQRQQSFYDTWCSRHRDPKNPWNGWGVGTGGVSSQNSISDRVGYRNTIGGFTLGIDRRLGEQVLLGMAAAYTRSTADMKKSRGYGSLNSYYLAPYATFTTPHFFVDFSANGFFTEYTGRRKMNFGDIHRTAISNPNGCGVQGHLDAGFTLFKGDWTVLPFVGFDALWQHQYGCTEHGAGGINLHIKASNYLLLRGEVGLGFAACFASFRRKVIPKIDVRYIREQRTVGALYSSYFPLTNCPFTVKGLAPNRNLADLGAEVTIAFTKSRWSPTFRYDLKFGSGYLSNSGSASFNYSF